MNYTVNLLNVSVLLRVIGSVMKLEFKENIWGDIFFERYDFRYSLLKCNSNYYNLETFIHSLLLIISHFMLYTISYDFSHFNSVEQA